MNKNKNINKLKVLETLNKIAKLQSKLLDKLAEPTEYKKAFTFVFDVEESGLALLKEIQEAESVSEKDRRVLKDAGDKMYTLANSIKLLEQLARESDKSDPSIKVPEAAQRVAQFEKAIKDFNSIDLDDLYSICDKSDLDSLKRSIYEMHDHIEEQMSEINSNLGKLKKFVSPPKKEDEGDDALPELPNDFNPEEKFRTDKERDEWRDLAFTIYFKVSEMFQAAYKTSNVPKSLGKAFNNLKQICKMMEVKEPTPDMLEPRDRSFPKIAIFLVQNFSKPYSYILDNFSANRMKSREIMVKIKKVLERPDLFKI